MNKADLVVANHFCNHSHMRNFVAVSVCTEKYQITFFNIFQFYLVAVAALFVRSTRKYNIYTLKGGTKQARTVHAYACGAAPSVWCTCIRAGCFYYGCNLLVKAMGNACTAGAVFRSKRSIFTAIPACQFSGFAGFSFGFSNFAGRTVLFAAFAKCRL